MSDLYIIRADYPSRDDGLPLNYGPFDSQKEAEEIAVRYAAELADAEGADRGVDVRTSQQDGVCSEIRVVPVPVLTVEKVSDKTPDISRGH